MLKRRFLAGTLAGLAMCTAAVVPAGATAPLSQPRPAARPTTAAPVPNGAWTVYHRDNGHTGFDNTLATATGASTGWVTGTMDRTVYAETLVFNGVVYAATLGNTVYAFDQATGATIWGKNVGAPQTSGWGCGNISPTGILGTPVIDTVANRLYAVAELTGSTPTYYLFGLDLANMGNIVVQTAITWPGFDWSIQQERGALALSKDRTHVYVPMGGRAGDCGSYHGYVFGVPTDGTTTLEEWNTPNTPESGIWSAGGVLIDDSTGKVFVTTGNGGCPSANDNFNDSVIRLTATLALDDYFFPPDWQANWSCNDQDLGSASAVLISPTLAFQAGKWGGGFLVNPQNLGGDQGELFPTPKPQTYAQADVCLGNHNGATFGSFAYAAPYVYLSCESRGLVALNVNTSTPSFTICDATCPAPNWNASGFSPGQPIVAGGAVWAVDVNGGGLYGFDAATGAQIYHSTGFGVTHFTTPSEAGGQIFVGSGNVVRSFNLINGCSSVTLSAAPPTSAPAGTTVNLSATTSGSNCVSPQYQFWIRPSAGVWAMVQDYSATSTFSWTATSVAGGYYFSVHAKSLGSPAAFEGLATIPYTLTATACTSVNDTVAPASPQLAGTPVTFTATATGCVNPSPLYEFWMRSAASSSWTMVKAYSTGNQFNWNTTGALGSYYISVWAKDAGSSTAGFDANFTVSYRVGSPACTGVTLGAAPASPQTAGTPVTFTATATGCTNASPLYEFWMRPASSSTWTVVQAFSTNNLFNWNTTGTSGLYYISVWAKDASSSTASFDANSTVSYRVNPPACAMVTLGAAPASPQTAGTPVAFTANATGCANASPLYEFWIRPASSSTWTVVQAFSTNNVFNWNTSATSGDYFISVWAKDAASTTANFDANATVPYHVNPASCPSVTINANPASVVHGVNAHSVITGNAAGCTHASPLYEFWMRPATSSSWTMVQSYSTSNTYNWDGTAVPPGTYYFSVWTKDAASSTATFDANATTTVTVT